MEYNTSTGQPSSQGQATNPNMLLVNMVNTILHNPLITHPFSDRETAYQNVPYTSNSSTTPFTVYDYAIGGENGARLASVSISVDAIFQSNFYWSLFIDGVTGPAGNNFLPYDPTVSTFEDVPTAQFFYIKPQGHVTIRAFNQGGTSTNGTMSVFVTADQLTQSQATLLSKYNALIDTMASQQ